MEFVDRVIFDDSVQNEPTRRGADSLKEKNGGYDYDQEITATATTTDDDGLPSPSHPMEQKILRKMDFF